MTSASFHRSEIILGLDTSFGYMSEIILLVLQLSTFKIFFKICRKLTWVFEPLWSKWLVGFGCHSRESKPSQYSHTSDHTVWPVQILMMGHLAHFLSLHSVGWHLNLDWWQQQHCLYMRMGRSNHGETNRQEAFSVTWTNFLIVGEWVDSQSLFSSDWGWDVLRDQRARSKVQAVNEFLSRDGSLVTHARGCHLWCRTLRTVVASLPTGVTAFDSMQNTTEKLSQTLAGQGLVYTTPSNKHKLQLKCPPKRPGGK